MPPRAHAVRATVWGLLFSLVLGALIVIGSRNLAHFDAALVGYTFATLFATFGITYRYAMWLQRPPTHMYWSLAPRLPEVSAPVRPALLGWSLPPRHVHRVHLRLSAAVEAPFLATISRGFVFVALAAWCLAIAGMAWHLIRR